MTAPQHPAMPGLRRDLARGVLSRREFLALASSLAGGAAALGLPATAAPSDRDPRRGGVLRVGMQVLPLTDPRAFSWPEQANVARQCLETLVRCRPDMAFEPWLLRGWEVSADLRTYTLHLRPGVVWTNGDSFGAEDVAQCFRRWCDADAPGNSMAARMHGLVDRATGRLREGGVEILGPLTVRLNLSIGDVALIANISEYPALVTHRAFDETGADFAAAPVSTGPFELALVEPGARALVRRRADGRWWGGEPWLDGVDFIDVGPDPAAEVAAFRDGRIDANHWSPPGFAEALDADGLTRHAAASAATVVARMNVTHPPYDDVRVRRALQMAVDCREVLLLGFGGAGEPAEHHHVSPIQPDYARLPPPVFDPAAARALLAEAGAADFEHELTVIDDDWRRNTADAIVAQLRDAGIPARRRLAPAASYLEHWRDYPFSITNWTGRPLGVQALALGYRTGSAWNETGFSDPAFDLGLTAALAEPDSVERQAIMAVLQRTLQASGAIIQPYWQNLHCHSAPRVHGYFKHPAHEMHLEDVWLDPADEGAE
ncbi:MAG: ABC transporter substrate-binding protein [Rubrimonas sp.]